MFSFTRWKFEGTLYFSQTSPLVKVCLKYNNKIKIVEDESPIQGVQRTQPTGPFLGIQSPAFSSLLISFP